MWWHQEHTRKAKAVGRKPLEENGGGFGQHKPETKKGNHWKIVLLNNFTMQQSLLVFPDTASAVVTSALDEKVFCYKCLPEQIYTDKGAHFELHLMTTLYYPQANSTTERSNSGFNYSLWSLLSRRGQEESDVLLPQLLKAYRGTPHSVAE